MKPKTKENKSKCFPKQQNCDEILSQAYSHKFKSKEIQVYIIGTEGYTLGFTLVKSKNT